MNIKGKKAKQIVLDAVAEEIRSCRVCRKNKIGLPVAGEGNPDADIVFIGEAPGKKEAASGRPFIGRAGNVLRLLIAEAGIKESDIFITSPVKYLPVHVTPTPAEVAHGRTHLQKQLDVIDPKIIVLLGRVAALGVLEMNISVAKEHGKTLTKNGRTYFFSYHPAAVLYSPKLKQPMKADFVTLKKLTSNIRKKYGLS